MTAWKENASVSSVWKTNWCAGSSQIRGCPRLPREPFDGDRLDRQLDASMTEFVNEERNVRFDAASSTVHLSKIFDWFRSDFEDWEAGQSGSDGELLTYINRYRDPKSRIPDDTRIRFRDYDKRLNRQE